MQKIERPIFIFGCCNSGTTILWEALKSHPQLSGPPVEGQDLPGMPRKMTHFLGNRTFRLWAHPKFNMSYYFTVDDTTKHDVQAIREVFSRYIKPDTRLVTKSPADTLRARMIQEYFKDENPSFIIIIKNGHAVAEGIRRKRLWDEDRPKYKGLKTTIAQAAEQWLWANWVIVTLKSYLKNYLIIKYEDLVEDPKDTLTKVFDFLRLDIGNLVIPVFRKDDNEKQIDRLTTDEVKTITRIAEPMLTYFDYKLL